MIFKSLRSILILFISLHSIKKTMALVNPYIQVNGLTRSVGDRVLFHDVSFGIAEGQHVGLIAQNGTGKTTLLNILAGKDSADEGSVIYRKDLRVGYLEQMPHYPMDMTVKEAASWHLGLSQLDEEKALECEIRSAQIQLHYTDTDAAA